MLFCLLIGVGIDIFTCVWCSRPSSLGYKEFCFGHRGESKQSSFLTPGVQRSSLGPCEVCCSLDQASLGRVGGDMASRNMFSNVTVISFSLSFLSQAQRS